MRVVFIGAVEFSRRMLERLLTTEADTVGVCTLRESSFNADHCDLAVMSAARGIPCIYAPQINDPATLNWISARQPDVLFCFGWSQLIRPPLLNLARLGVVGFHPAALPANRGRHPIIWALVLGLRETASTFFFMDEGADSGDILSQRPIQIDTVDDAGTLYSKVSACAAEQMCAFVPQLASGRFSRIPQDPQQSNTWRKRTKADGCIDWRMSAGSIHNLVRGLTRPYVGAYFLYAGREITVWKTEVVSHVAANAEPGKIVAVTPGGTVVRCGGAGIRLVETTPVFQPCAGEYL